MRILFWALETTLSKPDSNHFRSIRIGQVLAIAVAFLLAALPAQVKGAQIETAPKISADIAALAASNTSVPVFVVLRNQPQKQVLKETEDADKPALDAAENDYQQAAQQAGAAPQKAAAARDALDQVTLKIRQQAAQKLDAMIGPEQQQLIGRLRAVGCTNFVQYRAFNIVKTDMPAAALPALQADPSVAQVFAVKTLAGHLATSVPALGAPTFWNAGYNGANQSVAVLDTGVAATHPAFAGTTITSQIFLASGSTDPTFTDNINSPDDLAGHGTHVAGTVISKGDAAGGFANYIGVAPGVARLYNIKVSYKSSDPGLSFKSSSADVLAGLDWLVRNTAVKVVNYSYGVDPVVDDDPFAQAVDGIVDTYGLVFSAPAGNAGGTQVNCPVRAPSVGYNVIGVGGWVSRGVVWSGSCVGPTIGGRFKPDLVAPAVNITAPDAGWATGPHMTPLTGTSFATAHITGAAVLLTQFGITDPRAIKALLINSTDNAGWQNNVGWGFTNLTTALQQAFVTTGTVRAATDPAHSVFYTSTSGTNYRATLVWHRHVSGATSLFNDLNLSMYNRASGTQLAASTSTLQNVEQVTSSFAGPVVLKVQSASAFDPGRVTETYGLAASSAFTPVAGPVLGITCTAPASVGASAPFTVSCTVTNTGQLEAYGVTGGMSAPSGFTITSPAAQQSFGTVSPGASVVRTWQVTSGSLGGTFSGQVSLASASYGENFTASTGLSIAVLGGGITPAVSISPASGNGTAQTFTLSAAGGVNISQVFVLFNSALAASSACEIRYDRASNGLFLQNDAGTAFQGPLAPGTVGTLQNSQCSVAMSGVSAGVTGNLLTVVVPVTFTPAFVGAKTVWMSSTDLNSNSTGWQNVGSWTVAPPVPAAPAEFVPMTPCRVLDTRNPAGLFGGPALAGNTSRSFPVPLSSCGIPATATAYSINVTVVPTAGRLGFLTVWPTGQARPLVSTLNSLDGRIKANAAMVPAGTAGAISIFVTDSTHVVIDINGYFVPKGTVAGALAFYPLAPCRVMDTRGASGPFGGPALAAGQPRSVPVLSSACGVPATARAYSLNFTAVPPGRLGYITVWPAGSAQPLASTLNATTGTIVANAGITPAGVGGAISVFASNNTNLVIDINGYFAPPGGAGALSFYATPPCRVLDTRNSVGVLGGPALSGQRNFPITSSGCGIPPGAVAYSLNATVVPPAPLGFLTLWSFGAPQPLVSTLNAIDASITSNAAIVPDSGGTISAYTTSPSNLILDINGYFAP